MKCREFQAMIATDYMDDELDQGMRDEVEAHLKVCAPCREFARSLQRSAEPFSRLEKVSPPGRVWEKIRQGIEDEESRQEQGVWPRLRGYFLPPAAVRAPLFAAGIAMAVFLAAAGGFSLHSQAQVRGYFQEQESFLNSLGPGQGNTFEVSSLGTTIEEYLL